MRRRDERGLTLLETMIAITIFSIMTVGTVPLLGSAMKGGAASRTESVARNVAGKALERLRGLRYYVPVGSPARKIDVLDHFFPGRTPAYAPPGIKTGFVAASNSFVTTCERTVALPACNALPGSRELPADVEYTTTVTATFKDPENPATTVVVPAAYAWNSAGNDIPPSQLLEVVVQANWKVGAQTRTFSLTSYLGDRKRAPLPTAPTPAPAEPVVVPGAAANVKLRAEAKIDYSAQVTTTWQDTQATPRKTDIVATLGHATAYGEQLDSGSKADLFVNSTRLSAVRSADPAISSDAGYEQVINGATYEAHAPTNASSLGTNTGAAQNLMQTEVTSGLQAAWTAPAEAGTLSGLGGIGPTVTNGLPTVKGYYDFNSSSVWGPVSTTQYVSMMVQPQTPTSGTPGANSINPLNLGLTSGTGTPRPFLIRDADTPAGADPRGEVEVHSTGTSPSVNQTVRATANIVHGGVIMIAPTATTASQTRAGLEFLNFQASVTCESRPDPSAASTASGTWSGWIRYYSDLSNGSGGGNPGSYGIRLATLPVQTLTSDAQIPVGVDVFSYLKSLNGGNGPLIHDNSNNAYDVWMFAANGKTGLLKDWSISDLDTSISADDRVAQASFNGIIRLETSPLYGPWGASQRPDSDMTVSIGKLGCKTEDYR
jgi:prepilin-type N-terminal cleavage/methylation domain-containing protein